MSKKPQKRGPKPDHLVIGGDWKRAIKKAINKPKPAKGWPKESK
ncbi:MAG: hypothetical protein ABSB11_01640 [Sedimentisphaerales bacterium]|jgi:hypothetical protein